MRFASLGYCLDTRTIVIARIFEAFAIVIARSVSDKAIYDFKIPCAKFAVIASESSERSNPGKFPCLSFVIARNGASRFVAIYEFKNFGAVFLQNFKNLSGILL
ncbi:hypothetical protein [Campylobacter sp. JMF_08 NE1]|uniref:hypothetical protein n=1 Tax=Campylobacter sp. JMF_08 NE1 TaxID=2983821 RepID=UPI0022EA0289|nr:hypothetical protein [Campylobacter sp. JMF_08 NE1]MDA3048654.1 hypothetical protein [Campylobacter sp. JMF_08 NE1]